MHQRGKESPHLLTFRRYTMSENVPQNDAYQLAIVLAAAGRSTREIAAAVGVCQKTVKRWSKRESFRRSVDSLRADLLTASVGRLYNLMSEATDTLASLLKSGSEQVKLSAASRLIGLALRASDAEMRQRLDELEAQYDEAKRGNL